MKICFCYRLFPLYTRRPLYIKRVLTGISKNSDDIVLSIIDQSEFFHYIQSVQYFGQLMISILLHVLHLIIRKCSYIRYVWFKLLHDNDSGRIVVALLNKQEAVGEG